VQNPSSTSSPEPTASCSSATSPRTRGKIISSIQNTPLRASAALYPWDVLGDPEAAWHIRGLGVATVSLAAAYHAVRGLTPRHPRHRVVAAPGSAAYFPLCDSEWAGRVLRPQTPDWLGEQDGFGAAAAALHAAGLTVRAWVVLLHNDGLGAGHPDLVIRNAFGDLYSWALCPAQPAVVEYAGGLAAAAAARPLVSGVELEACGWYGFSHGHAHDKVAGVPLSAAEEWLMSVCFCTACTAGYARAGVAAGELRARVTAALDRRFAASAPGQAALDELLGADLVAAVAGVRERAAAALRRAVTAAVRAARPDGCEVLLHADTDPLATGANVGVDVRSPGADLDGLILPVSGALAPMGERLRTAVADCPPGARIAVTVQAVRGMNGDPVSVAERTVAVRSAGVDDIIFYHAGLASAADLDRIREAVDRAS